MDIKAIRADLADALGTIDGLNVIKTKPGTVFAPAAILGAYSVDTNQVFGGVPSAMLTWHITVVVADAAEGSFEGLDEYLSDVGDKSVMNALEGYRSTHWSSLSCSASYDVSIVKVAATDYIGCQFPIEIFC